MRISDWSSDVCSSDLNSEGSMNAQHRCDAHKNVDIQGKFAVLARLLSPAMKGRARRVSENEPALLFAETPEVRDRQERAEVWSAQTTQLGGFEPGEIDVGRRFDEGGRAGVRHELQHLKSTEERRVGK